MISPEYFIIGVLMALTIASNIFWAKICSDLTNKILAGSFREYETVRALSLPKVPNPPSDPQVDFADEKQAQEMNSLIGIG